MPCRRHSDPDRTLPVRLPAKSATRTWRNTRYSTLVRRRNRKRWREAPAHAPNAPVLQLGSAQQTDEVMAAVEFSRKTPEHFLRRCQAWQVGQLRHFRNTFAGI